ncbi:MAG: hypothetical protein AAB803_00850 [Patescibacteria group bacterium]
MREICYDHGGGGGGLQSPDFSAAHDVITRTIPVDTFVARYRVEHPQVIEALRVYPPLCYLLGRVTDEPQIRDSHPDGVERHVYYLSEGSGMFGLTHPEDAMRWRGIFNHIMGTARQVYWLADRLTRATTAERETFGQRGFDVSTFVAINPLILRDFMFISHAGRRQMDEYNWHGLRDAVHPSGDSGKNTIELLRAERADPTFLDLMRVEMHADHLAVTADSGLFPDMVDNVLTYPDWTFGQKPQSLSERFSGLRKSGRAEVNVLDILERCGTAFERALKEIVSPTIFEDMAHAGPHEWETRIRQTYCAASGLTVAEVFPGYLQQFPQAAGR